MGYRPQPQMKAKRVSVRERARQRRRSFIQFGPDCWSFEPIVSTIPRWSEWTSTVTSAPGSTEDDSFASSAIYKAREFFEYDRVMTDLLYEHSKMRSLLTVFYHGEARS
ncbi:hypothetical protein [Pararhizobium sp.]|uniref:hypothetical protein n=1 Tax=Pararhizobium sp. TaxID=1977563 RepID=UPI003D14CC40